MFESSLSLSGVDDEYLRNALEVECFRPVSFLCSVDPHELISDPSLYLSVVKRVQTLKHVDLVLLRLSFAEEDNAD